MATENSGAAPATSEEDRQKDPHHYWTVQIQGAERRLRNYYRAGDLIVQRFVDDRGDYVNTGTSMRRDDIKGAPQFRLNLFHTNVTTTMAMLYGQLPKVDVSRRFLDANDDIARVAAIIFQRLLNTSVEESGADFPSALRAALQDRLLPGHGIVRVRYAFETRAQANFSGDAEKGRTTPGDPAGSPPDEIVDEHAPCDYWHWRDFLWGYARTWVDVPWVGFRNWVTKDKVKKRWPGFEEKLTYKKRKLVNEDVAGNSDEDQISPVEEAEIIEIWDKEKRQVVFWSEGCDKLLETRPDPLRLTGFLPCAEPMIANPTTTMYLPVADFRIAQDLYNEIDLLQTRISIITKAIKVVGVYDQSEDGVKRMFKEGFENDLIPVDNWAAFAEKGGVAGVIDWYPVKEIVETLVALQETRQATIELLYQVTGLSDILRGAMPAPRESAASSMQRARFASIRVQHLQEELAKFASDTMRIRAEIIAKHWEPETIRLKANADALPEDPMLITQAIELIKTKSHIWPWRITIKPESIAMIDYVQMQQERGEFLAATATFMKSVEPLLALAPEAAPMILEMLKWGLAGYKGAQELEGVIDRMIGHAVQRLSQPQPEDQSAQKEHQMKLIELEVKRDNDMMEQQQKHQHKVKEMMLELRNALTEIAAESNADMREERAQAAFNSIETKMEHDAKMEQLHEQAKIRATSGNGAPGTH